MTEEFDQLMLQALPHFVAVEYQALLESDTAESKVRHALRVYQLGLRALTMGIVSQYLIRDANRVNSPDLNQLLSDKLQIATIDTWQKILITSLKSYRGLRSLFFMPELYDFFWDSSFPAPQPRPDIEKIFSRLTQIYNDVEFGKGHIDWPTLCDETLGLLRELLDHLDFFQNYELIRVIKCEGDQYWCERHTGLEVDSTLLTFKTEHDLVEGWFYLAKQNQDFLNLHPLLIFWEDPQLEPESTTSLQQFAIYEHFVSDRLQYMLTSPWKTVMEDKSVADFVRLIYYTLEQIKGEIPETDRLTWEQLWTVARAVSGQRMASVFDKYNPNLYLKRDNTTSAFEEFLASDKACFVLTGKSGVGKSNFLLALADEYNQIHPEICVLMYNGAKMAADKPLAATIGQDFDNQLKLIKPNQPDHINSIWREIAAINDITSHQVILFIDAINENPEAKALLRQIDDLVESSLWPWLKIVITSRPEAWRTIKRGVKLAETRYYRATGEEQLGIEMQPFSYSQQLESFTRDELPRAYTKYQAVYHLQTVFSDLSAEVKASLQDPLVLRLVAVTYHDQAIPASIKINQIYQNYIDHLIASERLALEDIRFLEQELLPLMLHEGHYANTLTGQEIDMARTTDGHSLFELIHGEGMLSSGRRVNQSYINLVDTEILVRHGTGRDYEIGFKYERFYEFFGGRHLQTAARTTHNQIDFYEEVIIALSNRLFLWGALIQALTLELVKGNQSLFVSLAPKCRQQRLLRSAMVTALERFGEVDQDKAESFIWDLIGKITPPSHTFIGELWHLLHPVKEDSTDVPIQKVIAVEAAARLKMTKLLEEIASNPSPQLRAVAAQHSFYLWRQDRSAGFQILDDLSYRVVGKSGIPNMDVVESMLTISGAILAQEAKDTQILSHLYVIGRRSLRKILLLSDAGRSSSILGHLRRSAVNFLHKRVLGALLGFAIKILTGWKGHAVGNLETLGHVFTLSSEQKNLLHTLVRFLDPDEPGWADQIADMLLVLEWGDYIAESIVVEALLSHGVADFDAMATVFKRLMNIALGQKPPKFWVSDLMEQAWLIAMRQNNPNPELKDLVEKAVSAIQEDPDSWLAMAKKKRPVPFPTETRASGLRTLIAMTYTFQKNLESDVLEECLHKAMAAADDEYLKLYIANEVTIVFESGLYEAGLQALQLIAAYDSPEVRQAVIELLTRARRYVPETVEDLLLQGKFPPDVVARVLADPSSERPSELMTYQITGITYDLLLLGPKPLRAIRQWIMLQALELPNIQAWFTLVTKELVNLLAGEPVFTVPDDAPSRHFLNEDPTR